MTLPCQTFHRIGPHELLLRVLDVLCSNLAIQDNSEFQDLSRKFVYSSTGRATKWGWITSPPAGLASRAYDIPQMLRCRCWSQCWRWNQTHICWPHAQSTWVSGQGSISHGRMQGQNHTPCMEALKGRFLKEAGLETSLSHAASRFQHASMGRKWRKADTSNKKIARPLDDMLAAQESHGWRHLLFNAIPANFVRFLTPETRQLHPKMWASRETGEKKSMGALYKFPRVPRRQDPFPWGKVNKTKLTVTSQRAHAVTTKHVNHLNIAPMARGFCKLGVGFVSCKQKLWARMKDHFQPSMVALIDRWKQ